MHGSVIISKTCHNYCATPCTGLIIRIYHKKFVTVNRQFFTVKQQFVTLKPKLVNVILVIVEEF